MLEGQQPGWYVDPDPRSQGMQERWWDGSRWSNDTRQVPSAVRVSFDRAWMILAAVAAVGVVVFLALNW